MEVTAKAELALRLHALLPQTQCTKCGYPDCASYAQAIAKQEAPHNQCPPGGAEGIKRLSQVLNAKPLPLNPIHGQERPRSIAVIRSKECIGCTLCIQACPVDAIVGSAKKMHVILADWCTGCDLCIPPCPVDCIDMVNVTGEETGWDAWSKEQAEISLMRYEKHRVRLIRQADDIMKRNALKAEKKLQELQIDASKSQSEVSEIERKKEIIAAALARARKNLSQ